MAPETTEPSRVELRISYWVLDVPVPQVVLDYPCVVDVICELIVRQVTQHVRVTGKGRAATFPALATSFRTV